MLDIECPYCSAQIPNSPGTTISTRYPCFYYPDLQGASNSSEDPCDDSCIAITFYKCPRCGNYIINACGKGRKVKDINLMLHPQSLAKKFPSYVPPSVRNDYEEAYSIVSLSPKASATLSRRCIQNMIRDFWGISKPRLVDEIDSLKDKVPADQWKVLHELRRLGNIGAHPETDVSLIIDIDSDDAAKILKVIELLIKHWYVNRHEQETLFNDICNLDAQKQSERKRVE